MLVNGSAEAVAAGAATTRAGTVAGVTTGAVTVAVGFTVVELFVVAVESFDELAVAAAFGVGVEFTTAGLGAGGGGSLTVKFGDRAFASTGIAGAAAVGAGVAGASVTGVEAVPVTLAFAVAAASAVGAFGFPESVSPSPRTVAPVDAIRTLSAAVLGEAALVVVVCMLPEAAGRRGGRGRSSYSCAETVAWLATIASSNAKPCKIPFINSTLFLNVNLAKLIATHRPGMSDVANI